MATGNELRNAIKGKGLTFEAAAKSLGISRQTLHTHMSKAKVDNELIKNVKEKLDISLSESKDELPEGNSFSDLVKAVLQQSTAILEHAETIKSQQYVIRRYIEKEPDIGEATKNG